MHGFFAHPALRPLMAACGFAAALLAAGCAVPVADPYGYDAYGYGGPAYPPAPYISPAEPAYVYGAPPLFLGGQIWIDSGHGRDRRGWRNPGRHRPDWQRPQWQHDRPGSNAQPRPHEHQRSPFAGEQGRRWRQFSPDTMPRPHAQGRDRADRSPPAWRGRGGQGEGGGGPGRGHR
ncbi:hypothetical protein [Comamonas badia]|uniref:hypothetical protein n=1 Tax=Comamonas badia TaxID=265291 RepID=UPI000420C6D4|nr:hypothetical protein [Comamonas badia]